MLGRKPNKKVEGQPERPKVYVRANGTRYVKVGDLLRSQRGQEAIKDLAKLSINKKPPL